MVKKARTQIGITDCACVIHGSVYNWDYVEKLYNMISRNLSGNLRFHVYTEHDRSVPPYMIKHCLEDWPSIRGPKKSWWYKLQLFNPEHHQGNLLYFDLDTVITNDITWLTAHATDYFWTLRDFRYLQRPTWNSMNSSIMWWSVPRFSWVWDQFLQQGPAQVAGRYHGDQDFIESAIDHNRKRYFDMQRFQSWRWQAWDGGTNFRMRQQNKPGSGTVIAPNVCALIFHGHPKPHEIKDPIVADLWH